MTKNFLESQFYILFYIGLVLGLGFSFLYASNQILTGDQTQMLYKGYLAARSNIWVNYGNAASAMGNVPGSLSTLLVGIPLKMVDSPYSPMYFLIALRFIGFLIFDNVIKRIYSSKIRLLFLVLCWLNPWFLFESLLYNPSYLFFFSAIHIWTAFNMRSSSSVFYSFLHILSIGMALQLHYSWPILVIITAYLFYTKTIKINFLGISLGVLVTILSLVPYLIEVIGSPALLHNTDKVADARYIGWGGVHVYPVLKAILYWLRYSSFLFSNKLITGSSLEWLPVADYLRIYCLYVWRAILFGMGGVSIILSVTASYFAWYRIRPIFARRQTNNHTVIDTDWLLLYTIGAFMAVLIAAILSPITLIYWHLMLVFPFALLPILSLAHCDKKIPKKNLLLDRFILITSFYFICVNFVASQDSQKYSYKTDYVEQTKIYIKQQGL